MQIKSKPNVDGKNIKMAKTILKEPPKPTECTINRVNPDKQLDSDPALATCHTSQLMELFHNYN